MKKLLLLLLCVPLIYSCENNKVKNINFEQIDDECELVEVLNMMFSEAIEYHDKYGKDIEDMPKHIQSRIENIFLKYSSIDQYWYKFNEEKLELCPHYSESLGRKFFETHDWWMSYQTLKEMEGGVKMTDDEEMDTTMTIPVPPPSASVDYDEI